MWGAVTQAQPTRLDLLVVDAETEAPLPGATAQIVGTSRGAVADAEGRLHLTLDRLPARVEIRFVGYVPEQFEVGTEDEARRTVALMPDRVLLDGLEVTGENAAVGIMRRVLIGKARLRRSLRAYAAEAYTRFTVERQGRWEVEPLLVRLTEALSNVYWRAAAGGREEVVARRRRPEGKPFAYAGPEAVPDFFFADEVQLDGQTLPTPTHPDALDLYDFKIGGVTEEAGRRLIDIAVLPTRRELLVGRVRVVDSLFVLADADLRLADPSRGGVITDYEATYRVTFTPLTDSLWLPERFERAGYVEVGATGTRLPRLRFHQTTWLYRFAPGRPGPASLWQSPDRYYAPAALYAGDEVYREPRERWPLADDERAALPRLENYAFRDLVYRQGFLARYIPIPLEGTDDPTR